MSNRKIWSIPIAALALMLMLAGAMAVSSIVQAQTPNGPPRVASAIDDVEITIGATDSTPATQPDLTGAFTDPDSADTLAYTAMTSDPLVAYVQGLGGSSTVAQAWWNALGDRAESADGTTVPALDNANCAAKAMRLGFRLDFDGDDADSDPDNAPAPEGGTATGLCLDYDDGDLSGSNLHDATTGANALGAVSAQVAIVTAFHWDMLSGAEMAVAAEAAGESNPNAYQHNFGALSHAEKLEVISWFGADNILNRGEATSLQLENHGIDSDGTNNDLDGPLTPDGQPGMATITVKASDSTGRLIPPGDGSGTVGQSFDVTASLTGTGNIVAFATGGAGVTNTVPADVGIAPTGTFVTAEGVEGASTGVSGSGGSSGYDITIGADAKGAIARVYAQAGTTDLARHHQKLEFILRGDAKFQIKRMDTILQYADIVLRPGATLTRGEKITLMLQVNELGNVGANNTRTELRVEVVEGGAAPMLRDTELDAHFAANPVKVREHMAGNKSVVTEGLPFDFASFTSHGGGQALEYTISPSDSFLSVDKGTGMVTLSVNPDGGASSSATYETAAGATNTPKFTLTANDGTRTATYDFTVMITTNKAKANVSRDDVELVQGNPAATPPTEDMYVVTATVNLRQDDRGKSAVDLRDYITGVDDPTTLVYVIKSSKSEFSIGSTPGDSMVFLNYVPDPDDVDYGSENMLTYTGDDALVVTIDDGYDNQEDADGSDIPDLELTINLTVNVEPPPTPEFPVANVDIDENMVGVVLAATDVALTSIIGAENVTVAHAGGSNAGALDADGNNANFSVDEESGEVSLVKVGGLNYEVDGGSHTLTLSVTRDRDETSLGSVTVVVAVNDVNEVPVFAAGASYAREIEENAQIGATVGDPVMATDQDGDAITFRVTAPSKASFAVVTTANADGSYSGQIQVSGAIDINRSPYKITITAMDDGSPAMSATQDVEITLGNINDPPEFDAVDAKTNTNIKARTIAENARAGTRVATFTATDKDGGDVIQGVHFVLRDATDTDNFNIENESSGGENIGVLSVATGANLEYDIQQDSPSPVEYTIEVNACDADNDCNELTIVVTLENSNDETPVIGNDDGSQSVDENSPRGTVLGDYGATDKDNLNQPGFDTITYTLEGTHRKEFQISGAGVLMTLASLDYDTPVPCRTCDITVVATDDSGKKDEQDVTITVTAVEDSISTLNVSKANPVPGTAMGEPRSALAGTKIAASPDVPERPADLPATYGAAPMKFVATEWANWGTVLRIEVTAESPGQDDPTTANVNEQCGNGNQCVVVTVSSDSADDTLLVEAYRSAEQENKFVAAVMLVELANDATPGDAAVYKHTDDGVPALRVDEEDEIEVEFGNLRSSIDVENEAPEVSNFAPGHELAFDDADVDYTFTVTDDNSGLPEPEDLPDPDGDDAYTPVVALISEKQCETHSGTAGSVTSHDGNILLKNAAQIYEDEALYCPGDLQDGEYIAGGGGYGFAPIRDDKDFDEIDNGYDVETTLVLTENDIYYVTFIVCDAAGNCAYYDPDGNDEAEELAQITVDTEEPVFVEARTGVTWDSGDNEYDDDRNFVQVIFDELTELNPATVEADDFVVEGHTIKDVHVFENPDKDDVTWADSGRYILGKGSRNNKRGTPMYQDIENSVFVELEDELLADETPDVTIVPNGVEDAAGNEQDDGDHEADDWIAPMFTIVSIVSPRETGQSEVLAGDEEEVVVTVTADERLDATRPTVTVTYVNAPIGSVNTKDGVECTKSDGTKSTRERGEIVLDASDKCGASDATGGTLNNDVEKVSNTEWIVTITEPKDTGYYNFHISGKDRSSQKNEGSEGVSEDDIVTDFFDSDGDVNLDDAVFFEGDINLAKPNVRVSGVNVTDNEADVEYRSPLFVELDFTRNHSTSCNSDDNDFLAANCTNENSEYAEDNFDDIVVTMFSLDGVDMTDSVRTTDNQTFLISLESIALGDHTAEVQAMDQAGNVLEDTLEIDFEVNDRDPFERRLNPGWNLVSLPGEPADSSIGSVFGPGVEVQTVYTYDPVVPGGWMVAVRETLDSDWQGDLTEITGTRGYWVLSDAIQDWEVVIPRLAGGAAGTGTPIQPPVIALYAGWNLIPVTDISGNGEGGQTINADVYLQNLDDGLDLARVLGFDTIRNQWATVLDPDMQMNNTLRIGDAYWIFVREAASLVPSGYVGGGGSD